MLSFGIMPHEDGSVYMQQDVDINKNHNTDFGFKKVKTELKTNLVKQLFKTVSAKYDLMNDCMSLGLHRIWKNTFIKKIALRQNMQILDLAGGTGDVAINLWKNKKYLNPAITVCDLTFDMLHEGRRKAHNQGILKINWHSGNAENLPYADNAFDIVTIAFGLRNVTDKSKALQEMARVLKPGGKLYCLEFSPVQSAISNIYDLYSFKILPWVGEKVADNREAYQYLVESIRNFPDANTLQEMFEANGLKHCVYEKLTAGIVAIHTGEK